MSAHRCHARGCDERTSPKLFMCKRHWLMVPDNLKARIWDTYKSGQEVTKTPSRAYLTAALEAMNAVAAIEKLTPCRNCNGSGKGRPYMGLEVECDRCGGSGTAE